jgi:dTDP-glucose 4,6-dehydratase
MTFMKLLITGGAGFIGSNFIHSVLEKYLNDEVINLDMLTYAGNLENVKRWDGDARYRFVKGDIGDAKLVDEVMRDVDVVVHFAAESHVDRSILDAGAFVRTNVLGTQILLDAALRHGKKRFHHVSTDEVFGALQTGDKAFDEATPYAPRSPYSASKAGSDHLVRAYFHSFGLPVTISNCSNNYGPYHFPEKLIPLAITNLLEGKKVPVYGAGLQVRDWLFVTDHCRAIDAIVRHGIPGETYCVGGGNQPTNVSVVKTIVDMMGKSRDAIEFVAERPGHDFRYDIDYSKIKKAFGWEPSVSLNDGLKQTIEWFVQNDGWWKRIKSGEYQAYYQQQYGNK